MAEFLRRARPRGLAKAASSRERSWRIGWTRMTLASLDSCTGPATMVTSRQVRPQDRPARYSGAGEGDRGHYSGCEAPVVGGFVNEGEQLSVATGHIPKPRAWILVRVRDDPGSTAKEISFPRPTSLPPPVVGAEARASHRTTLAALGVVHGGEPSRPPRAHGCELVPPIWSASTAATRHQGMPVRSDPGRSSPASAA